MKKLFVFLLIVILVFPLAVGGLVLLTYSGMDESTVPQPVLLVQDEEIAAQGYEWNTPVFGGIVYKNFVKPVQDDLQTLGEVSDEHLSLTTPPGYISTAVISKDGIDLWSGSAENASEFILLESGNYMLEVNSQRDKTEGQGYGHFQYFVGFSTQVDTRLESSAEVLAQGDVLALQLYNVPENTVPEGGSTFSPLQFSQNGQGRYVAYLSASHDTLAGDHNVSVTVGGRTFDVPVQITETQFTEQQLTIDTSDAEITEANSADAYTEYNNTIPPLFLQSDSNRYWNGYFIQPVDGELTTEYGLYRYTNGSSTPSRHAGIDWAASRGTDVVAPNAGRVIFSGELLNTGNTVVIEHGNGLKSLFYHLNSLDVALGDTVDMGDKIGEVGSTGYSTGSHLHYEVRLFENTVDPMRLFEGTSGLYSFEEALPEEEDANDDA